jgi:hypothetical protein
MAEPSSDSSNPTKTVTGSKYELLVAIVLGVLAVGSFGLQALTLTEKTTKQETVLFNTLQFLLTVGFAWFSTRAVTRNEFEASLKRFAISAYRRISDIENMIQRLQTRIVTMRAEREGENSSDLDIAEAIVADTIQVVSSSIADWADVIGEELIALETIKRLKNEKAEIKTDAKTTTNSNELDLKVKQIDEKISNLISSLPVRLQFDTRREANAAPSEKQVTDWIRNRHKEQDGLRLDVISGGRYQSDRKPETVRFGEPLKGIRNPMGRGITVQDFNGVAIGRLLNNSGFSYSMFSQALQSCYGKEVPLEFVSIEGIKEEEGVTYTYSVVRTTKTPANSRPPIALDSDDHVQS